MTLTITTLYTLILSVLMLALWMNVTRTRAWYMYAILGVLMSHARAYGTCTPFRVC